MTSKAEFSYSWSSFYICSICVAITHLATILYKKMKQIYKNRKGLSLLNSAFDLTVKKDKDILYTHKKKTRLIYTL